MDLIPADDPRLAWWCPQPVDRAQPPLRLERFPRAAYEAVAGQIGPLANLRSSAGCALVVVTDSPRVELVLERLRHHQHVPCGVALEVERSGEGEGAWLASASEDLREREGEVRVGLATGLERGGEPRPVWLWLPVISTCAVAGLRVTAGARVSSPVLPEPRWLALGDSLTQGFSVQSPLQTWVHRLMRRWDLPAWNLGVGGIRIEPAVFAPALAARRWDLVTIALGSNHCWRESEVDSAAGRAAELAELALAGGHGRVVWILPPWKPCEEGKGPGDFQGVPLDAATGLRVGRVRAALRARLAAYAPRLELLDDLMPHDHRLLPDGLHPAALGFARYADNLAGRMGIPTGG
jgi:lysophospholipase L1-like esterase